MPDNQALMSGTPSQPIPPGHALFARYALPPNELGYCGPADANITDIAAHAREFDGTWPYLTAIAEAAGVEDPLDADVVESYWVGGPLLARVDPALLLGRLRDAFKGQVTGLLADLTDPAGVLAHHSFHVCVVYPWVRFLSRDATTALQVMQNCRIRWGVVESVDADTAVILSQPLVVDAGVIALGDAAAERVEWRHDGPSSIQAPRPGQTVSAHWHRICDTLTDSAATMLATATQATLDLVNVARSMRPEVSVSTWKGTRQQFLHHEDKVMTGPSEHRTEEAQSARGEPGSRDTGSDQPSGGPTDRPSGKYRGDETVPAHDEHGKAGDGGESA